jgi:transformation/transcription domain-associated protein
MERMRHEPGLPLVQLLESKRLAACILAYVAAHPEQTQPLLDVFTVYTVKSSVDMNFVGKFVMDVVCKKFTVAQQQQLLLQWVAGFRSEEGELAVVHLTQLVLPLLQHALDSGEKELLSDELIDKVVDVLGGPDDRYGKACRGWTNTPNS